MFGSVGGGEILVLLVLGLLLFGPRKLPAFGRTLGKALSDFRSASTDFRINLEREVHIDEVRSTQKDLSETAADLRSVERDPKDDDGA